MSWCRRLGLRSGWAVGVWVGHAVLSEDGATWSFSGGVLGGFRAVGCTGVVVFLIANLTTFACGQLALDDILVFPSSPALALAYIVNIMPAWCVMSTLAMSRSPRFLAMPLVMIQDICVGCTWRSSAQKINKPQEIKVYKKQTKAHRPAPCPRRKHGGGRLRKLLLNRVLLLEWGVEPSTSFDLGRHRVGSPPNTVEPNTRCVVLIGRRRLTV